MSDCIFCKIAQGTVPAHIFWENDKFLAFLDINPVSKGATVLIPKEHYDSYIKNAPDALIQEMMHSIKRVMDILDTRLEGNIRTRLVFEGLEVPHLHAKLWPTYEKEPKEEPLEKIADKLKGVL